MSDTTPEKKIPHRISGSVKKVAQLYHPDTIRERGWLWATGLFIMTYLIIVAVLMFWWDGEPDTFDVRENAQQVIADPAAIVTGSYTTSAIIRVARTLLDKPGGYLSNDIMPPGVLMDNTPAWEYGVLTQVRDITRSLRNDISRSQSQSVEDKDLSEAEPQFNFQNNSWLFPATESEYEKGIEALQGYANRLALTGQSDSQFYARADNLSDWLAIVEKRLGSLSQRLSASVGQIRVNTDLAGDSAATQSTQGTEDIIVKTPWSEVDDVFYEARGTTWALVHFLSALEIDFADVLNKKAALPSLRQIIRELETTQSAVWSPVILNGGGFGVVTNHSLVMASYISRANAAVIDLRSLLQQG